MAMLTASLLPLRDGYTRLLSLQYRMHEDRLTMHVDVLSLREW